MHNRIKVVNSNIEEKILKSKFSNKQNLIILIENSRQKGMSKINMLAFENFLFCLNFHCNKI